MPRPKAKKRKSSSSPVEPLATRVRALPMELFDTIYEYVFTTAPEGVRHIDTTVASPATLHVDHQTRRLFASAYFNNAVFAFHDLTHLEKWLVTQPPAHLSQIKNIVYQDHTGKCHFTFPFDLRDIKVKVNLMHLAGELKVFYENDAKARQEIRDRGGEVKWRDDE